METCGDKPMKIISKVKNKFISKKGETLTETLSSLLIIVPAMVMLAGAIVTAARINNEVKDLQAVKLPDYSTATAGPTSDITGNDGEIPFSDKQVIGKVTWYKEENSIYYYFK